MQKAITILFLTISTTFFAQKHNLEDGFIAKGYDVVAYFNNSANEGKREFSTTYNSVKFKFISKKNLALFKSNPEKFMPQYGGFCAYALGKRGKLIDIDPESFEIRDGKLYLFYNSWFNDTFEKWKEGNPNKLRKKADENWTKMRKK